MYNKFASSSDYYLHDSHFRQRGENGLKVLLNPRLLTRPGRKFAAYFHNPLRNGDFRRERNWKARSEIRKSVCFINDRKGDAAVVQAMTDALPRPEPVITDL